MIRNSKTILVVRWASKLNHSDMKRQCSSSSFDGWNFGLAPSLIFLLIMQPDGQSLFASKMIYSTPLQHFYKICRSNATSAILTCVYKNRVQPILSEMSNFCQEIQFWQNPNLFTSFSSKFFLTIFLVKSKLSTAKKSKTTTISRVFHPNFFWPFFS